MLGQTVLHYKIERKLGEGGMGAVFLATDTKLDRKVALKFLPPHFTKDPEFKARFEHEAKAAAALNHPNIVTVHELNEHEGRLFIAMEYVDGKSLEELIAEGDLPLDRTLDITRQICEGLREAHQAGIVHRDIKPSNILIDQKGRAKILDFGLAKSRKSTTETKTGTTLGTLQYESPEQCVGKPVDARSDLFSLGSVLYEMITGRPPFTGEVEEAIRYSILNEDPEPLARYKSGVSKDLQRLVSKLLAKDLKLRYQNACDVSCDLRRLQSGDKASSSTTQKDSWNRYVVGGAVIVLLILTAIWLTPRLGFKSIPESAPDRKMIAVLPFENLGDPDDEYFADGITDEITGKLATISGLGVISRTSAMQYKNTDKSLRQIGEELGVDYVLEGTIRWETRGDTDRVRVQPQLVQVSDDTHLWAKTYERPLTGVFEVQSELATHVAEALNVALLDQERRAITATSTRNLEAYQAYLRGVHFLWTTSFTHEDGLQGIAAFERAIEYDSAYALAYARLASIYSRIYHYGYEPTDAVVAKAKDALDQAFRLTPQLPEAYLAKGWYYYWCHRDYDEALEALLEARRKLPNDANVLLAIGAVQRRQGLWDESIATMEEAFKLNPRDPRHVVNIADSYLFTRRYVEADRYYGLAAALAPDHSLEDYVVELSLLTGTLEKARAELAMSDYILDPWYVDIAFRIELYDRNYGRALTLLDSVQVDPLVLQREFTPLALLRGTLYRLQGDSLSAGAAFDSARVILEAEAQKRPNDHRVHSSLGIAYAGLGRTEYAVREGELGLSLFPVEKDAWIGPRRVKDLALIYTMVGRHEEAIDQIAYLLSIPAQFSAAVARLDPCLDPLRDQPRFQALIEKGHKVF